MRAMVLLLLAACASSPRQGLPDTPPPIPNQRIVTAPVLNPVGQFEFSTMTPEGTPIRGTISISGAPGAYTGSIDVRLTFVADDFTGSWQLGTDTGEMAGKRKPSQ
jgi:hypothetical protein